MGQAGSRPEGKGGDADILGIFDCCQTGGGRKIEPTPKANGNLSAKALGLQRAKSVFDEIEVQHAVEQAKRIIEAQDLRQEDAFALTVTQMTEADRTEMLKRLPERNEVVRMVKELARKVNSMNRKELDSFFERYSDIEKKRIEITLMQTSDLEKIAHKFVATRISSSDVGTYSATIKTEGDGPEPKHLRRRPSTEDGPEPKHLRRRPSTELQVKDLERLGSESVPRGSPKPRRGSVSSPGPAVEFGRRSSVSARRVSLLGADVDSPSRTGSSFASRTASGTPKAAQAQGNGLRASLTGTLGLPGMPNLGRRRSSIEDNIITTPSGKVVSGRRPSQDNVDHL